MKLDQSVAGRDGRGVSQRRLWGLSGVVSLAALAGCGGYDDHCHGCGGGFAPTEVSYGLVAGDFSHNGFTSVVATTAVHTGYGIALGSLRSYLSTGAGTFAAPVSTSDGDEPLYLASTDLNGDGLPDIVSASYDDGDLAVFSNNAQSPGTFDTPLLLPSPGASQVAIADMNGDGLPDLVSADFNVSLFIQTSPGTFANPVSLYSGGANWVALGDLNHDGIADVALTDATGVKLLMHTGAASATTFDTPVSVFTQTPNVNVSGANIIAIGDLNGDGFNDLVITDPGPSNGSAPTVSVLLQNPASPGTFLPALSYATAPNSLAFCITLADLQGSGKLDLVIGGSGSISVLLHDPANPGAFLAASNYAVSYANQVAVADVNADGHPDIIVTSGVTHTVVNGVTTNAPGVLLQNAATPGTFAAVQDLP